MLYKSADRQISIPRYLQNASDILGPYHLKRILSAEIGNRHSNLMRIANLSVTRTTRALCIAVCICLTRGQFLHVWRDFRNPLDINFERAED